MRGHLNPEQAPRVIVGKAVEVDRLARYQRFRAPVQGVDPPVGKSSGEVIDLPVGLQQTVVDLAEGLDEQHQVLGRVPTIHPHGLERQPLLVNHVGQHVADVFELGLTVGVVEAEVDQPALICSGIEIDAGHDPDAFDHHRLVVTALPAYQFNLVRSVFVQHGIVEQHVAVRRHDAIQPRHPTGRGA